MMDSVKCQFSLILSLTSTSLACLGLDTVCGVEVLSVILFSLLPRVCVTTGGNMWTSVMATFLNLQSQPSPLSPPTPGY